MSLNLVQCMSKLLEYGLPAKCGECVTLGWGCPWLQYSGSRTVKEDASCKECDERWHLGDPICYVIERLVRYEQTPLCNEIILIKRSLEEL